MNRLRLALLTLALGTALIGCAEKKDTAQKPKQAVSATAESAPEKPVELEPAASVPEKAKALKEDAPQAVKAPAAVEKVKAAEKAPVSAAPAFSAADSAAGVEIYKKKCAPCHGGEGKGTTMAPALKGNEWVRAAPVGDITGLIRNGRQANEKKYPKFFSPMPASKTMSEGDLGSLAAYLKSLN